MNKLSIFMNKNYKYKLALNTKFTTPQRVYSLSTRLVNAKPQQNSGKIKNVKIVATTRLVILDSSTVIVFENVVLMSERRPRSKPCVNHLVAI